jgi:hypothetical protein
MVRRTGVASPDSGTESVMYGEEPHGWPGSGRPAPAAKAPWSGGGGRWTVWPMRIILWAALIVVAYRGIMAIALNEKPASSTSAAATANGPAAQFPAALAEAFATQFGHVYLNYDPANAQARQQQLAYFLAPSLLQSGQSGTTFGMSGNAATQVSSESVVGIDVRSASTAVVSLLATVNDRQMEFGVPIYAQDGGIVVSGLPSLQPIPQLVTLPTPPSVQQDTAVASQLKSQLPGFFKAYASASDTSQMPLSRFLAPGASVGGISNEGVQFKDIVDGSLNVPQQGGTTRNITVTVDWQLTGQDSSFAATYDMSVVDQGGDRWYVKEIRASTQPMGTAP